MVADDVSIRTFLQTFYPLQLREKQVASIALRRSASFILTLSLDVICTAFDLQAERRPHLLHRCEAPGSLRPVWVTTVVLLQTPG